MDPLTYFPPEITDLFFSYLSVSEILSATEVSTKWNEVIGASLKTMKRVQLKFFWEEKSTFISNEVLDTLVSSKRKYQNIDLKYQSSHIDAVSTILSSNNRQWKSVKLKRLNYSSEPPHFIDLLKHVEKSVVKLELNDFYVTQHEEEPVCLNFNNLKVLKMKFFDGSNLIEKAFFKCQNLEELQISSSYKSSDVLKTIFKQNPKLKYLQISSGLFNEIFSLNLIQEIPFKLKVFKSTDDYRKTMIENLVPFFEKHMNFLEEISLSHINVEALQIVFHMPKLKKLRLGVIHTIGNNMNAVQLHVNQSIEVLSFHDNNNNLNSMKKFINATPNVKDLEMFSLTQPMMTFLSANAKKLEKLQLRCVDITDISNRKLFPCLKQVKVEIISAAFENHMLSIPQENQNSFVKLVLNSCYVMLH